MSHMRYAERRREAETVAPLVRPRGFAPSAVGRDGVGAHFEAGDAFAYAGRLVVGYGPRTEELALKHLATELDVQVVGVRITHPGMYHLDLGLLPARRAPGHGLPRRVRRGRRASPARPGAGADRAHRGRRR